MDLENVVEFFFRDPIPRFSDADIEEMRELGATEDQLDELLDQEEGADEVYEVLPDNFDAVQLFQSCFGKFLTTGTGQVLGFDFNAVDIDIERSGLVVTPDTWAKFKVLERLTVTTINQRRQS